MSIPLLTLTIIIFIISAIWGIYAAWSLRSFRLAIPGMVGMITAALLFSLSFGPPMIENKESIVSTQKPTCIIGIISNIDSNGLFIGDNLYIEKKYLNHEPSWYNQGDSLIISF